MTFRSLFAGLTSRQKQDALAYRGDESHGDDTMTLDYQMLNTLELLAERPLDYEYQRPIQAIERALRCGLATASEPRKAYIEGRWRHVRTVTVTSK